MTPASAYTLTSNSRRQFLLSAAITVAFALALAMTLQAQTVSVVYNFGSQTGDPFQPFYSGIIAQGRDGNLYSGATGGLNNAGALFKLTPSGTLAVIYAFANSTDGSNPNGGLTLGTDGNFYGTTYGGGFGGAPFGTVFKVTPQGALTNLYTFTAGTDGALPLAPPIQGTDGNFYGVTCPGCNSQPGYGSIYKITSAGVFTTLYTCDTTLCGDPTGPLLQGKDGNFYGTSTYGGATEQGTIFKITPAGVLTVIYNFDNTHGEYPIGGLVQGTDGNFYGTALDGGTKGYGTIFKVTPAGRLTVLHNMNGASDGGAPYAGLVQATDGNFYGANAYGGASSTNCPNGCGTIFRISPTGSFKVIYNFDMTTGSLPYSSLFQHTNGLIYGMTQGGGSAGLGVVYSVNIGASTLASLVSTSGKVGKMIEVLGQGFTGTTKVSFGGASASFKVVSDGYLTATVPTGATTAAVTITTPSGTLTSKQIFRVTPQVTGFSPTSGSVGTSVTITGVSLTQATKVTFGGVSATFTVNSDTQITATVPTGAKTGKIGVTTPGGSASSTANFTVM